MILTGPDEVLEARLEVRLSPEEAAKLVGVELAVWNGWESPIWSEQYDLISYVAWRRFLILTHDLREKDSKYRARRTLENLCRSAYIQALTECPATV